LFELVRKGAAHPAEATQAYSANLLGYRARTLQSRPPMNIGDYRASNRNRIHAKVYGEALVFDPKQQFDEMSGSIEDAGVLPRLSGNKGPTRPIGKR